MAYHSPLPWVKQWRRGTAKDPLNCLRCGKEIHQAQLRVALKKDRTFCYHLECWEVEYKKHKYDLTDIDQTCG